MYTSQIDLEDFMSKYPEDGDTKPQGYCEAAEEYIRNYLRYDPEQKDYITTVKGDDGNLAVLEAFPITQIVAFSVDGIEHDITEIEVTDRNYIEFVDGSTFKKGCRYTISYKAGYPTIETEKIVYSDDGKTFYSTHALSKEVKIFGYLPEATGEENEYILKKSTVPQIIKTTALQIASLFWESAGGNLAVSSTSFADTGSRVFNNFKADRFTEQIEKYKRNF